MSHCEWMPCYVTIVITVMRGVPQNRECVSDPLSRFSTQILENGMESSNLH